MSLASPSQPSRNNSSSLLSSSAAEAHPPPPPQPQPQTRRSPDLTDEATASTLLGALSSPARPSMDRGAPEYSQSGLPTPYPHAFTSAQSEESPADPASAAQYTPQQEVRANNYPPAATPTSEYGVYPASARSGSFPEHIQRQYHPASNPSGSSGGAMAQSTSPSMPPPPPPPHQDPRANHRTPQSKSDPDVPIDPSIAASSPTYPAHSGQYSPYPPQQEMQHPYQAHGGGAMYTQPRPDWAGYATHPQHGMPGYAVTGAQTPTSAAPAGARPGQVGYPVATHPAHLHQVNSARPHCELQIVVPRRVPARARPAFFYSSYRYLADPATRRIKSS